MGWYAIVGPSHREFSCTKFVAQHSCTAGAAILLLGGIAADGEEHREAESGRLGQAPVMHDVACRLAIGKSCIDEVELKN